MALALTKVEEAKFWATPRPRIRPDLFRAFGFAFSTANAARVVSPSCRNRSRRVCPRCRRNSRATAVVPATRELNAAMKGMFDDVEDAHVWARFPALRVPTTNAGLVGSLAAAPCRRTVSGTV
jgi:hypothetical protein